MFLDKSYIFKVFVEKVVSKISPLYQIWKKNDFLFPPPMYQIYLHNDGYPFPQCINFTLTTMGGNAFLGCHDAIIVVLGQVTMIGIRGGGSGGRGRPCGDR